MAEKRMFAMTIIDSDAFLELPLTAQLLYFHLAMRADDDGFINKPRSIMRLVGAKDEDMKCLISNKFCIYFETGVVVIKHWRIHNTIQKDRYKETKYKFEKAQLYLDENKSYTTTPQLDTECIQSVSNVETQSSLDKIRLDKDRLDKNSHSSINDPTDRPTWELVSMFGSNEGAAQKDIQAFWDYYSNRGWTTKSGEPISDWKAVFRKCEEKGFPKPKVINRMTPQDYGFDKLTIEDLEAIRDKI